MNVSGIPRGFLLVWLGAMAMALGTGLHADQPGKADLLQRIGALARNVRDLTGQLEERFTPARGHPSVKGSRIWIKTPDRRRQVEPKGPGLECVSIEVGTVSWFLPHPKLAQKTVWPGVTHFIPTPVPNAGPDGELAPLFYLGTRDLDGEPCLVFGNPFFEHWIGTTDGLLRQKIQFPAAGDPTGTTFTQRFRDLRINTGLADSLFEPVLRPGAIVDETVHQPGRGSEERRWTVPFPVPALDSPLRAAMDEAWGRSRKAFDAIPGFSCRYQSVWQPTGVRSGGEPVVERSSGTLRVARSGGLELRFDRSGTGQAESRDLFALTDGITAWECLEGPAPAASGAPGPLTRLVIAQNVAQREAMAVAMKQAAGRAASRAVTLGEITEPPAGGPAPGAPASERFPGRLQIPLFVIEPLAGIATDTLTLDGEEVVDGTATWRFLARETPTQRQSIHWIGQADGIPRRVQEYDWMGIRVEREFTLSGVETVPEPGPGAFAYHPLPGDRVEDMTAAMASAATQMQQAFDVPPRGTFRGFFATSPDEVTGLAGSGMAFLGLDVYIRFLATGPVTLREAEGFLPADPAAALTFFGRAFPDEAADLRDAASPTFLLREKGPGDRRLWLRLPDGRQFFRAIQGRD